MKYQIYILLFVLLIFSCNKDDESQTNALEGKIKTLVWYDPSNVILAFYEFHYDSTGNLLIVKQDTSDYIVFSDFNTNSIRMSYYQTISGIPNQTYKRIYIDANNNVNSIYTYDTITLMDKSINCYIHNNINVIDSIAEGQQPFPAFPSGTAPKNNQFEFDGNKYLQFSSTWSGIYPPITGSNMVFYDTVRYNFTEITNDGQVPLQIPIRTYKWNFQNNTKIPGVSNMLYMLGIKGIGNKPNKYLIESIKISGSQNYIIEFEYLLESNGKVKEMKVIDNEYGSPNIYTFKMTYY